MKKTGSHFLDRRSWRVGRRLVRSLRNSPQGPEECIGKQLRIDPGNEFKHGDRLLRFPLLVEKFWKLAIHHSMNDDDWEEEVKFLWFLKFHLWCCHAGKVKSECSVDGFCIHVQEHLVVIELKGVIDNKFLYNCKSANWRLLVSPFGNNR